MASFSVRFRSQALLERAFGEARGTKGESLPAEQARSLSQAVQFYRDE